MKEVCASAAGAKPTGSSFMGILWLLLLFCGFNGVSGGTIQKLLTSNTRSTAHATSLVANITMHGECLPTTSPSSSSSSASAASANRNRTLSTTTTFQCFSGQKDRGIVCRDQHPDCGLWSKRGECRTNPGYMLVNCATSCDSCPDGHGGMTQLAPDDAAMYHSALYQRIVQTQEYLYREASRSATHAYQYLRTCQNEHELCTLWAVQDECNKNPAYMNYHCAPACQTCDKVLPTSAASD